MLPIFNLDNIPANTTSGEFSVYDHNEINCPMIFLQIKKKIRTFSLKNGKGLDLIYSQSEKNRSV